jgi:small-conductance mechanosensitive channel
MLQTVMQEVISWQVIFLASLLAIGFEIYVFDLSLPRYYREIRLNFINLFMFLFASTFLVAFLSLLFQSSPPYIIICSAVASVYFMLFIIIWLIPSGVNEEMNTESEVSTVEEKRTQKPQETLSLNQGLISKLIYSTILFFAPVLLLVHVQKNSEYYLQDLKGHKAFLSHSSLSDRREIMNEEINVTFAQYLEAMNLHFFSNTKIECAQTDIECLTLQNRILRIQNNRAIFLAKILYYFMGLYLMFRYYGQVIELYYMYRPRNPGDLGLQSDVVKQCSHIISISFALILALIIGGVDFSSLGVFAGLIGAGVSVALKDILENMVAGIFLLWGRTIKRNDVITIPRSDSTDTGSTYAVVKKMTMRFTLVEDRNEVRRLIPNSKLINSTIENWTHEDNTVRLRVLVDVDYDTDLRMARTILESVCYEVQRIDTKKQPPKAVVLGFGEYAIRMALRFWINDPQRGLRPVLSDVYIAITERFREEGIKIPYPRRDLHITSPDNEQEIKEDDQDMTKIVTAKH